ncbi:glycoside hydrolase superfamily [Dactylonectria estremocensis]|uniref:chitinase n=1 Tax=Dactylonectria estremocensis TaxID=1079267 RepID=A0A9P9FA03_9HYPO|nr:glycoside hydrolase superfamily [Dactylonectria estremocensis]
MYETCVAPSGGLNGYWGQYGSDPMKSYCDSGVEFITLSFVNSAPEHEASGWPGTNFAGHCPGDVYMYGEDNQLKSNLWKNCYLIQEGIPYCQSLGVKVLISIGGDYNEQTSNYAVSTEEKGRDFADILYSIFGPKQDSWTGPRPFDSDLYGTQSVDGFDFDIEKDLDMAPYIAMIDQLRIHDPNLIITAAPQCPTSSQYFYMEELIQTSPLDALFVQFYNNQYCDLIEDEGLAGDGFNYQTWEDILADSNESKSAKIYVGLPASASAAGTGYVGPDVIAEVIDDLKDRPSFGGISLWDLNRGASNVDEEGKSFNDAVLEALCGVNPSASSTASVSATATSTSDASTTASTDASTTASTDVSATDVSTPDSTPTASGSTSETTESTAEGTSTETYNTPTGSDSTPTASDSTPTGSATDSTTASSDNTSTDSGTTPIGTPTGTPTDSATDSTTASSDNTSTDSGTTPIGTPTGTPTDSATESTTASSDNTSTDSGTTPIGTPTGTPTDSATDSTSTDSATDSTSVESATDSTTASSDSTSTDSGNTPTGTPTGTPTDSAVGSTFTDSTTDNTSTGSATDSTATGTDATGSSTESTNSGSEATSTDNSAGATTTSIPYGGMTTTESASSTTSTVYTTHVYTVTKCPPEVTNCPAGPYVTTEIVPLYTTVCPVTAGEHATKTTKASKPDVTYAAVSEEVKTVYTTNVYTVTKCPIYVVDCPVGSVTTEVSTYTTTVAHAAQTTAAEFKEEVPEVETVYTTKVHTITKCPAYVTNCPVGSVTTEISSWTTTVAKTTGTAAAEVPEETTTVLATSTLVTTVYVPAATHEASSEPSTVSGTIYTTIIVPAVTLETSSKPSATTYKPLAETTYTRPEGVAQPTGGCIGEGCSATTYTTPSSPAATQPVTAGASNVGLGLTAVIAVAALQLFAL